MLLGIALYIWLPSNIAAAKYLTPGEVATLEEAVARDYLPGAFEHDWRTVRQLVKMVLDNRYFWLIFTSGTLMSIAAATYTAFTPSECRQERGAWTARGSGAACRGGRAATSARAPAFAHDTAPQHAEAPACTLY